MNLLLIFLSLFFSLLFFTSNYHLIYLFCYSLVLFLTCLRKRKTAVMFSLAAPFLAFLLIFFQEKKTSGYFSFIGLVIKSGDNYYVLKGLGKTIYVIEKANTKEIGDLIRVEGNYQEFGFSHYQESFDFGRYLNSLSCFSMGKIKKESAIIKTPLRIKVFFSIVTENYSSEGKAILGTLVFGKTASDLPSSFSLKNLGLLFLFTSGGIHIGAINELLKKIMDDKIKEKYSVPIRFFVSVIVLVISGFGLGVMRVVIMNGLSLTFMKLKRSSLPYQDRLCLTFFIILLFAPFAVLNTSLIESFFILLTFSFFRALFPKRNHFAWLKVITAFYFSALPFTLASIYGLSPLTISLSIVLSPLSSFLYLLNLLSFFGPITRPFVERIDYLFFTCLSMTSRADSLLLCGKPWLGFDMVYFILIYLYLFFKEINLKKSLLISKIGIVLFCLVQFIPDMSNYYEVHFIDVGQGDATLIRYERKNILIDTGGNISIDLATNCLIPYLRKNKIYYLDALLTTHDDYDHVGALDSLVKNFSIKKVLKGGSFYSFQEGEMEIKDINIFRKEGEDTNYNSAVYSFSIKETSFLIMGDAPIEIEKEIIQEYPSLNCDILKLGHHGSDTSSCKAFLEFTSPKKGIISCGYHNKYGHPSKSVVENLDTLNIPYSRTDLEGTVVYKV